MQLSQFAKSYKSVAVATASPGQLVLMLFDGALKFLSLAEYGFELENISSKNEQIHNNLIKAQAILTELQNSLDLKVEGEFATKMHALYGFMLDQLFQANMKKEIEPIKTVERLLKEVRDAWSQMLEQSQERAA